LFLGSATIYFIYSSVSKAEEIEEKEESVMEQLTPDKIKDVMTSKDNKLIYFYRPSTSNPDELKKVEDHANKMLHGMKIKPYIIDIEAHHAQFSNFLKERNPKTADSIDEQIKNNSFLLAN